ncbi:MAG: DNA polymerase III subunit alpha, partial [Synergistaceae bacterium]|nr:DNA polymerase III subunit alpha [Synergistaceae bacterium]
GIRAMLRKLRIDRFEDLVAALAMYRPGPLDSGMVDTYIECKHGRKPVTYPHPLLEKVLKETYGVILYQEQVMQCASVLAGYSLGEADILRKAMGKKKVDVMQEQKVKFLAGAEKNKIDSKTAADIFDNIEKFAGYGFNKSHSAAYALISYDTAWLKANYKVEFLASYLSSQMKAKKEVLGHYVLEVRRSGVQVLPPDINSSRESFTPDGKVIRFGLGAVSRMGHNAIKMIVEERDKNGNFKSLWDFIQRVDKSLINKTAIENLIKAGAFDRLHDNRAQLINALPMLFNVAQNAKKQDEQISLFDSVSSDDDAALQTEPEMPFVQEYNDHEKLNFEKTVTGLYMSGHPYESYQEKIQPYTNCTKGEIEKWRAENLKACFGGIITSITEKTTKNNDTMAIVGLEDSENNTEVVVFSRTWANLKEKLQVGTACIIEGQMGNRGQIIVSQAKLPTELENAQEYCNLVYNVKKNQNLNLKEFVQNLRKFKGNSKVILILQDDDEMYKICLNGVSIDSTKVAELSLP